MINIKLFLLSVGIPAGSWATWATWVNLSQHHLIIQMLMAVVLSLSLFAGIMWATDATTSKWPKANLRRKANSLPFRSLTAINPIAAVNRSRSR